MSEPGFFLLSEPGPSGPGAFKFFCLVSEPGLFLVAEQSEQARSEPGMGFFCLLDI